MSEIAVQTDGGSAATHEQLTILPLRVAPTTADERNRVLTGIIPIASWRVEDLRFEFGMSFVRPEIREEIIHLKELRESHKVQIATPEGARPSATLFPPISIFGHADPVGGDDFNKVLSGRRAIAIYALLTRQTNLWEDLHTKPLADDDWGRCAVRTMLAQLGFAAADSRAQGADDPAAALQSYQAARGLPATGQADSATRKKLYLEYMDSICGADFVLDPEDDFLGRGQDHLGKGDYQGCSDFNLVRIFSQQEKEQFDRPESHALRNIANARNRRVVALLFQPGTYIDPRKWPCPRASEGVSGCRKRFWSDAQVRRSNQTARREYKDAQDTFGCRFYDRISSDSPCERRDSLVERVFQLQIRDYERNPLANCPYSLTLKGKQINDSTDASGFTAFQACVDGTSELRVKDQTYKLTFAGSLLDDIVHTQALLNALGFSAGPLDGNLGRRTEDALRSFQRTHRLNVTGKIDEATSKALRQEQLIQDLDSSGASTASPSNGSDSTSTSSGSPQPKALVKSTSSVAHLILAFGVPTGDPTPAPAPVAPPPSPPPTPTVIKTDATSRVDLPPPHSEFTEAIVRRWSDMNLNGDGFLTKDEIDVALGKTNFKGIDGAMVATLKTVLADFEQFSDDEVGLDKDGITQADVNAYERFRLTSPKNSNIQNIDSIFASAKRKINDTSSSLFAGDPDVFSVKQGLIGDCWFLAALVGVGFRNKADIVKMVKRVGSTDKFEVTFPGAGKTITVDKPTDGETAIFATAGANGFWLSTLEKAYGASINKVMYFFVDSTRVTDIPGGFDFQGIEIMTGNQATSYGIGKPSEAAIRKELADAYHELRLAVAAINPNVSERTADGLPTGHAYTVLNYIVSMDTITLRNPWGNTGPKGATENKGVFQMKMADFLADFSTFATEDPKLGDPND